MNIYNMKDENMSIGRKWTNFKYIHFKNTRLDNSI